MFKKSTIINIKSTIRSRDLQIDAKINSMDIIGNEHQ